MTTGTAGISPGFLQFTQTGTSESLIMNNYFIIAFLALVASVDLAFGAGPVIDTPA
jgi:hypothetical protein